jgi:hypothetical protein
VEDMYINDDYILHCLLEIIGIHSLNFYGNFVIYFI